MEWERFLCLIDERSCTVQGLQRIYEFVSITARWSLSCLGVVDAGAEDRLTGSIVTETANMEPYRQLFREASSMLRIGGGGMRHHTI
jgi:hypothetical protein